MEQKESGAGAVIFVTGVRGDWSSPAKGLYPRLCNALSQRGYLCVSNSLSSSQRSI
jgi:hypothetical protein